VPGFIRACTAVCFLERDFPISFHGPTIPSEILACGTPLVVSREITNKQRRIKDKLVDGKNVLIVNDPKQHLDLARQLSIVIRDPDKAKVIGLEGHRLYSGAEDDRSGRGVASDTYLDALENEWMRTINKRQAKLSRPTDGADALDALRKARLKARLPWTSSLLNGRWDQLVNEYCRERPVPAAAQFEDALGLCESLEAKLAELDGIYGYFIDAFRYEKTHNLMLVENDAELVKNPAWAPRFGVPVTAAETDIRKRISVGDISELRPLKSEGVHIQAFDHDLQSLATKLQQGEIPRELAKIPTFLLFKREPNFINLEFTINHTTKRFLDLCDGEHTVRAISTELARVNRSHTTTEASQSELVGGITQLVRELALRRIIKLARRGSRRERV
jgi:hypothetical protein